MLHLHLHVLVLSTVTIVAAAFNARLLWTPEKAITTNSDYHCWPTRKKSMSNTDFGSCNKGCSHPLMNSRKRAVATMCSTLPIGKDSVRKNWKIESFLFSIQGESYYKVTLRSGEGYAQYDPKHFFIMRVYTSKPAHKNFLRNLGTTKLDWYHHHDSETSKHLETFTDKIQNGIKHHDVFELDIPPGTYLEPLSSLIVEG